MAIGEAVDVANELRKARGRARPARLPFPSAVYAEAGLTPVAEEQIDDRLRRRPTTGVSLGRRADPVADVDAARRGRPPRHVAAAVGGRLAAELRRLVGIDTTRSPARRGRSAA